MGNASLQSMWDDGAEAWVEFVRSGKDYYRDELNNPAFFELLGNIRGKRILDLGCGEGYNSRIMARKGARVVGIDFSQKMIDFAVEEEENERLGIDYYVLDARNLHTFEKDTFDTVACFMALQDIEDYRGAVKETCRVLKKHGRFVFSIPHPCFERRIMGDQIIGGWEYREGTEDESLEDALYYKVDRYFEVHSFIIPWKMERLTRHFETTSFHRTLTDYASALYDAGLAISRLTEPIPTREGIEKHPTMKEHLRIPQSVIIEAVKR
ncbi:MAG: class I SAM-dependent methyltransferase [Thermoplasmata archaeon]